MSSRVPRSNLVIRRLNFDEDSIANEGSRDNLVNQIHEVYALDRHRMREVYNFDSQNDVPLEGRYRWRRGDGNYDWIGKLDDEVPDTAVDAAKNGEATVENAPVPPAEPDKVKAN